MEGETRGDGYGETEEKTWRNAVNPQATAQSSGERKEEFLCAAGEQNREGGRGKRRRRGEGDRQMEKEGESAGVAEGI